MDALVPHPWMASVFERIWPQPQMKVIERNLTCLFKMGQQEVNIPQNLKEKEFHR
jgi:hypothetical protein